MALPVTEGQSERWLLEHEKTGNPSREVFESAAGANEKDWGQRRIGENDGRRVLFGRRISTRTFQGSLSAGRFRRIDGVSCRELAVLISLNSNVGSHTH